jgi:membrane glycosyltransferase
MFKLEQAWSHIYAQFRPDTLQQKIIELTRMHKTWLHLSEVYLLIRIRRLLVINMELLSTYTTTAMVKSVLVYQQQQLIYEWIQGCISVLYCPVWYSRHFWTLYLKVSIQSVNHIMGYWHLYCAHVSWFHLEKYIYFKYIYIYLYIFWGKGGLCLRLTPFHLRVSIV